jgi:iron(III) transport system substrate-binding protein
MQANSLLQVISYNLRGMSMKRSLSIFMVMLLLVLLASCGSKEAGKKETASSNKENKSTQSAELTYDELVKKAKEEGKVVVYGSSSPERFGLVAEAFKKQFGIDVMYNRTEAGDLANRIHSEHQSGKVQVDVVVQSNMVMLQEFKQKGYVEKVNYVTPETADEVNAMSDGYFTPIQIAAAGIMYDSDKMKTPTSWEDLLNPDIKQFAIQNPASNNTFIAVLNTLRDKYGDEFIEKLGEKLVYYDAVPLVANNIMAKEVTAGLNFPSTAIALINKQPSSIKFTDELGVTSGITQYQLLMEKGQHHYAGLLFMNWNLTAEAQKAWNGNDGGATPLKSIKIDGVRQVPDGFVPADYDRATKERDEILSLLKKGN